MILKTDNRGKWPQVEYQIDDEDYEKVSKHKWYCYGHYIQRCWGGVGTIYLHIEIMGGSPIGLEWDHINRDKLDNRKENLRAVIHRVNGWNRNVQFNSKTGISGVYLNGRRWQARIKNNGEFINLGIYDTVEEAAKVRCDAEKIYWTRT